MKNTLPKLQGAVARLLAQAAQREDVEDTLEFAPRPMPTSIASMDQRMVALLGCMLLEQVRAAGGSRVPREPVHALIQQLMRGLSAEEVMTLEVELYDSFDWLTRTLNPGWQRDPPSVPDAVNMESSHLEIIRWAMHHGSDLEMAYFHPDRGELTHRVVTPLSLRAETYLMGFCHLRMDERVFRLSRIGELKPAAGWPVLHHEIKAMEPPDEVLLAPMMGERRAELKDKPAQMSFFGEEEE